MMPKLVINSALPCVLAFVLAISSAFVAGAQEDPNTLTISLATHDLSIATQNFERLRDLELNDIAGLRKNLEGAVVDDVTMLWTAINDEHTEKYAREECYIMLRLIAVQNEKFPISSLNSDVNITEILQAAERNDEVQTERFRRQVWGTPK